MNSNIVFVKELLLALKFELIRYRFAVVSLLILVMFSVLGFGLTWNNTYVSTATLEVDDSNIIQPLLRGKAEFSEVNRADEARKSIFSKPFLESVALRMGYVDKDTSIGEMGSVLRALRAGISIGGQQGRKNNFFSISYASVNPQIAYDSINVIVEEFVKFQQKSQRQEGEYAYEFIKKQANQYKRRLKDAEFALQEFKAQSLDTNEQAVQARIGSLEGEVQELTLSTEGLRSTIQETKAQLKLERQYLESQAQVFALRQQKKTLENQLIQLRTQYQESYPDIVSLKEQIAQLQRRIRLVTSNSGNAQSPLLRQLDNTESNPELLFDELRRQLSVAEVDLKAKNRRIESLRALLAAEREKADILVVNQSKAADLMRDYTVNKNLYEDFLSRKETAELSVAISRDGRGLAYRVVGTAEYPYSPTGLTFLEFLLAAPVLALGAPIGLLLALIILDPRIRTSSSLQHAIEGSATFLGVVGHSHTALSNRIFRKDMLILGFIMICVFALYSYAAYTGLNQSV